jgi:hypothetical protein
MRINNEPNTLKTEDGYTFHRLDDGSYADNLDKSKIDMSWDSYIDMLETLHAEKISFTVSFS